jgi:glycerol uptake facilitator protein
MVYALSHISGSHINPAVSIALATTRRISWREAGAYCVSQLLGGLLGALLIAVCFGARSARTLGYGATDYNPLFVNYFGAIVTEAIVTFFLMFVIMAMVMDKRTPAGWAGLMVGLTLGVSILVTGPITGGNLNPARAFGPTIIELLFGAKYPFWHMFVFFIGPIIGAICGAFAYEYLGAIALARQARRAPYGRVEPGD